MSYITIHTKFFLRLENNPGIPRVVHDQLKELLQQQLTGVNHPDHTLITYPNLGHVFYPSSRWFTEIGPIQQYVLADLYAWLAAHSGFTHHVTAAAHVTSTPSSNSTAK